MRVLGPRGPHATILQFSIVILKIDVGQHPHLCLGGCRCAKTINDTVLRACQNTVCLPISHDYPRPEGLTPEMQVDRHHDLRVRLVEFYTATHRSRCFEQRTAPPVSARNATKAMLTGTVLGSSPTEAPLADADLSRLNAKRALRTHATVRCDRGDSCRRRARCAADRKGSSAGQRSVLTERFPNGSSTGMSRALNEEQASRTLWARRLRLQSGCQ